MKTGDEFAVDNVDLLEPLIETIVTVTIEGEKIRARVKTIGQRTSTLKVVANDVKE